MKLTPRESSIQIVINLIENEIYDQEKEATRVRAFGIPPETTDAVIKHLKSTRTKCAEKLVLTQYMRRCYECCF